MSIFDLHQNVVRDYRRYVQSFLSIADDRIRQYVEKQLVDEAIFWPDALLQLNPAYRLADDVDALATSGTLTSRTAEIFRDRQGKAFRLYRHQMDALTTAVGGNSYVVTSGTGSGKSLTYFIPICDAILRGNHADKRVWAIVIYPMNALVNSQYEALNALKKGYEERTGHPMPIRFAKYTGQENEDEKIRIQDQRPHILLTNFMMLEMMLLRPQESAFVDKENSNIQFLVLDELHMYRGRQGADVAMLIRRLKERCGNANVRHIGTSATMVADRNAPASERREAVAEFATRLFGSAIAPEHVIEETLQPLTKVDEPPTASQLVAAIHDPTPQTSDAMLKYPLTTWVESAVGLEKDPEGAYRRKLPRPLTEVAAQLAEDIKAPASTCTSKLRETFLVGSQLKNGGGGSMFAFKLHQFISQGRPVYSTLEGKDERELTLDGQYYAKPAGDDGPERLLFPLVFCRICGQEYYRVLFDESGNQFTPWDTSAEDSENHGLRGYVMVPPTDPFDWSMNDLPPEWIEPNGKVKKNYRALVPRELHVQPDGGVVTHPGDHTIRVFYQTSPMLICQNCGEFYSLRDRDFRKLTGLSNEGRSSATTTLSISKLDHAEKANITGASRKLLSFTDNRQDASLQAGHFNDFVQVSLLRAAIYQALEQHCELRHYDMAEKVMAALSLNLKEFAANEDLDLTSAQADRVRKEFRDLIQYRIYEDLRRAWRVIHPNLEQCGLLRITYEGLQGACVQDALWEDLLPMAALTPEKRFSALTPFLDFARKKLVIRAECLRETYQQQLRQRVNQVINERWRFDDTEERLRSADRLILPNQTGNLPGISLGSRSLIARYFRRTIPGIGDYDVFIVKLISILTQQGLLRTEMEKGVRYVQLEAAALLWQKGDGNPPAPDPIYSRRAPSDIFTQVQQKANEFFAELYRERARSLRDVEGLEHTAQIKYENRERREERFRNGDLRVLFCSPTMELGIDIRDLQLVHMRNVPPSPASYAQRSGRAGRSGDPALIVTYCSAASGHDQYFFRRRQDMVAGSVRPPRIDLSNEDMVRAHLQALWFSKVNLHIQRSVEELLDLQQDSLPLKENVKSQTMLSEQRLLDCINEADHILELSGPEVKEADWYRPDWTSDTIRQAAQRFDLAFDRWRQLFRSATLQLLEAQKVEAAALDDKTQKEARQRIEEAKRQRNLLMNVSTTRQESDFYPYRYLASEGFLPGYNFPRLPIRVYIPREDGEFLSRARFLALTEFGPENFIYHEGSKFQVNRFFTPPGGLSSRKSKAKTCNVCGYYNNETDDRCGNCRSMLDGSSSLFVHLLDMPNAKTIRRERITCDEEERIRRGYRTSTHFRFAVSSDGRPRTVEATVGKDPAQPLIRTVFAPSATMFKINHGWKGRNDDGYYINLVTGEVNPEKKDDPTTVACVRLFVSDTENLLLLYPPQEVQQDERAIASLQFALQRGMEQVFQVEESELASERIGEGDRRAILYWEAAEGGVGVLRRLVEEENLFAEVARASLERLHFDPNTGEDKNEQCNVGCYECLLSYRNQFDHRSLNRHLILDLLRELSASSATRKHAGREYEGQYVYLRNLTDSRSELERLFIAHLYNTRRDLPDEAQKALADAQSVPDFYYSGSHACVYCDGSVHDSPEQKEKDDSLRKALREKGYRVIVIRYDRNVEEQVAAHPEVFGLGKK